MKNGMIFIAALVLLMLIVLPAAASVTFETSSPQTMVKGDTVTIHGAGATNGTVAVWVIGRNYFHVSATVPEKNGTFTAVLEPGDTGQFSSGQYAFVIQDPGANGKIDIGYHIASNGNITIQHGGTDIADIGPKQDIRANAEPVVRELLAGTTRSGADDIFTPYYFLVEEPAVHFDRGAASDPEGLQFNMTAGERIIFTGTTNMGAENTLHADIRNAGTNALISSAMIPVITGNNTNRWSFAPDTSGFLPGEYVVTVGWMKSNSTGTGSALLTVTKNNDGAAVPLVLGAGILLTSGIIFMTARRTKQME